MPRTTGTETEISSSSEMEHAKNKFEDTLRRLAMQVELSKTMPSVEDILDDDNKSDKLLKNATDKVCYTQENTMDKECRYHLRTRKRIKSAEDLLVEDHERLMAIWDKSHKESMSYARKEGKVFLQMVTVMAHEDRKAMLKRDHEERLSMIQKLSKIIRSKLENRVERLRLAIDEDISAHLETHSEEIIVKSEKMLDAEFACRRRVY